MAEDLTTRCSTPTSAAAAKRRSITANRSWPVLAPRSAAVTPDARWTTVSASTRRLRKSATARSTSRISTPGAGGTLERRSNPKTSCPVAARRAQTRRPTAPVEPVTTTLIGGLRGPDYRAPPDPPAGLLPAGNALTPSP